MDERGERRLQALRTQLHALHYFEPVTLESAGLVEKLISDVVKSVEAFQQAKKETEEAQNAATQARKETEGLRRTNPRLVAENNELHRKIIAESERVEEELTAARRKVQRMEEDLEGARFLLQQQTQRAGALEAQCQQLNQRVQHLAEAPVEPAVMRQSSALPAAPMPEPPRLPAGADRLAALTAELAVVRQAQRQAEMELQRSRQRLEATGLERDRLAEQLATDGTSLSKAAHAAELAQKDELVTRLTQQLDFLNGKFVRHKGEDETGAKAVKAVEAARAAEAARQHAEAKAVDLAQQLHKTEAELAAQRQEVDRLEAAGKQRDAELERARQAQASERDLFAARVGEAASSVQQEQRRKQELLDAADEARQAVQAELVETQARLSEALGLVGELRTRVAVQESGQDTSQRELARLRAEVVAKEEQHRAAEGQLASTGAANRAARDELLKVTTERAEAQQRLAEQQQRGQALERQLQEMQQDHAQTAAQVPQLEAALERLLGEKHALEVQLHAQQVVAAAKEEPSIPKDLVQDKALLETSLTVVQQQHAALSAELEQTLEALAAEKQATLALQRVVDDRERDLAAQQREQELRLEGLGGDRRRLERQLDQSQAREEQQLARVQALEAELHATKQEALRTRQQLDDKDQGERRLALERQRGETTVEQQRLQLERELERQKQLLADVEQQRAGQQQQVLALELAQRAVEQTLEQTQRQLVAERQERGEEQDRSGAVAAELSRLQEQHGALKRQLQQAEETEQAVRAEVALRQAADADVLQRLADREGELALARQEVAELVGLLAAAEQQRSRGLDERRQLDAQHIELSQQRDQAASQLQQLERQRRQHLEQKQALEQALQQMDGDRDELQRLVDEKATALMQKDDEVLRLQQDLDAAQREVEKWRYEKDVLVSKHETRGGELEAAQRNLGQLTQHRSELSGQLQELRKERGALIEDLTCMTHESQQLHGEVAHWQQKVQQLTAEVQQAQLRAEEHCVDKRKVEAERDDVLRLYRQLGAEKDRSVAACQALAQERETLCAQREELRAQLAQERADLEHVGKVARARELDVCALKQQFSDQSVRLADAQRAQQSGLARADQCLEETQSLAQQLQQRDQMRLDSNRGLASVQAQARDALQQLQHRDSEVMQLRAALQGERQRSSGLERLIAEMRRDSAAGPQPEGLARTVSQQYALIGQLDAENIRLQHEVAQLKQGAPAAPAPAAAAPAAPAAPADDDASALD